MAMPVKTAHHLSPSARAARDRLIREERAAGMELQALAERYGVSVATVKRAARAVSPEEEIRALSPAAELLVILHGQHEAFHRLLDLMHEADNTSAAVGAARGVAAMGETIRDTLAAMGQLEHRTSGPAALPAEIGDSDAGRLDRMAAEAAVAREFQRWQRALFAIAKERGINGLELEDRVREMAADMNGDQLNADLDGLERH
jgi:hypothetical protein